MSILWVRGWLDSFFLSYVAQVSYGALFLLTSSTLNPDISGLETGVYVDR